VIREQEAGVAGTLRATSELPQVTGSLRSP